MIARAFSRFQFLAACALGAAGVGQAEERVTTETWTNSLAMEFVRLPAGEFTMGSPETETERFPNETPHRVTITRPFWMGTTHVTVAQFDAFVQATGYQTAAEKQGWSGGAWNVAENKWDRREGGSWRNPGFEQRPDHPVVCITWHDAVAFCEWLAAKEGRPYRLPTEAEWEYATRAGQSTAYPWGDNPDGGAGRANGSDRTSAHLFTLFPAFTWSDGFVHTSPVASFRPNAWGLYDLPGNALQWCSDWFGDYPASAVTDPQGAPEGGQRVLRGGAFLYGPRHCRSAFRGRSPPDFQNFYIGFRLVLETAPDAGARPQS